VEVGELNRPQGSPAAAEKVLDSPAKSESFKDFSEHAGGPKRAEKDPNHPEKPDRVRSTKRKPQKQVIAEARTAAGLTQRAVDELLRRGMVVE
jgi:hypothetical protein